MVAPALISVEGVTTRTDSRVLAGLVVGDDAFGDPPVQAVKLSASRIRPAFTAVGRCTTLSWFPTGSKTP
jgi:hypothetical protein